MPFVRFPGEASMVRPFASFGPDRIPRIIGTSLMPTEARCECVRSGAPWLLSFRPAARSSVRSRRRLFSACTRVTVRGTERSRITLARQALIPGRLGVTRAAADTHASRSYSTCRCACRAPWQHDFSKRKEVVRDGMRVHFGLIPSAYYSRKKGHWSWHTTKSKGT